MIHQVNSTYPNSIVAQLQHRQIRQFLQIFNFRYFVGAQIQLLQLDQFVQIFDFVDAIEAQIQNSVIAEDR